jgi:hypothetical protein
MIKTAEDLHLTTYTQQRSAQQLMAAFVGKLQAFTAVKTVKQMGSFMANLRALASRGRNENSKREMLRVNSRLDRDYDDFELDRNQYVSPHAAAMKEIQNAPTRCYISGRKRTRSKWLPSSYRWSSCCLNTRDTCGRRTDSVMSGMGVQVCKSKW